MCVEIIPRHLFFYGTLVAGNPNLVAAAIHAALEPLGPARTGGVLYAIPDPAGWFPALVAGVGEVKGALYRAGAGFDTELLARMDAYEDFEPADRAGSLYRRESITVRTDDGAVIEAAAYLWNRAFPPGAERVHGGHFATWLAETGHPVFEATRSA
ncbi:gamma-glutamylcyclotransferase family protein [Novosphingobium sp.]|uniref:gamma-glutamylcyclotransferase family protein n=1 Tax=Novosphingobium sp. TaxID=1874826 RepID=UPI0025FAABCC|nr:gamma-glutamylcyclotransferase family protein [Novosphingobium sp.]